MADAPIAVCEVCGAGPVEKLLFPVAVHFKGKGFYATDYGRASRGGSSKDGESGSAGKEASKDSKESSTGDKSSGGGDSGGEKKSSSDGGTSTSSKSD